MNARPNFRQTIDLTRLYQYAGADVTTTSITTSSIRIQFLKLMDTGDIVVNMPALKQQLTVGNTYVVFRN